MVADSFRSEQMLNRVSNWFGSMLRKAKRNYYEVDGYLFRRDKILGRSIGQLIFCVTVCEFSVPGVRYGKISHKGQILLLGGAWREQLPAPGNRSNERRYYREKDLGNDGGEKVGTGEREGGEEKSRGREK
ncbi:hypothetical protein TNCV_2631591 [Trichonephila clavipes]|nr:hypothetical protein TNCV_2631591 [Trichonephila clavipes]